MHPTELDAISTCLATAASHVSKLWTLKSCNQHSEPLHDVIVTKTGQGNRTWMAIISWNGRSRLIPGICCRKPRCSVAQRFLSKACRIGFCSHNAPRLWDMDMGPPRIGSPNNWQIHGTEYWTRYVASADIFHLEKRSGNYETSASCHVETSGMWLRNHQALLGFYDVTICKSVMFLMFCRQHVIQTSERPGYKRVKISVVWRPLMCERGIQKLYELK